jgi:hypothetical protein
MCLGINYDACCGTSRSVPLLRPVKMERKGLKESFVTQHLRMKLVLVVHVATHLPETATRFVGHADSPRHYAGDNLSSLFSNASREKIHT